VLGKFRRSLERAVFSPDSLNPAHVTALAITPPVLAGLLLFGVPALEMLAMAVALGGLVHLAARRARWPLPVSPAVPAVIGVAMVGPGAPILFAAAVALIGALLELIRTRFLGGARLQVGLLAYAGALLASRGVTNLYLNPSSLRPLPEPIQLWLTYGGAPIDSIRLYVGNVPGPVFATSLMAVAIGIAWLWYARRLSLAVVAGFGLGAVAVSAVMPWNVGYQLDSGPAWFVLGLLLADRRALPTSLGARPLIGLVAGVVAMAVRARGVGIEGAILAVAGIQLAIALVEGAAWVSVNRRRVWTGLRSLSSVGIQLNNPLRRARRTTSYFPLKNWTSEGPPLRRK